MTTDLSPDQLHHIGMHAPGPCPKPPCPLDGTRFEHKPEWDMSSLGRWKDRVLGDRLFPSTSIGEQTALDLPYGPPPPQLAHPFLTSEGATIVYGKGGTGKGLIACYLAKRLVQDGKTVMVVDFEYHQREWGSRLRGMGLSDDELSRVHWRSPSSDDWTAKGGNLGQVWELIRADCDLRGVDYLIVDSYTTGSSGDGELGGQEAAKAFFQALSLIQRPALVIAHVAGNGQRFPEKPFGSVFVHNLARETWAAEAYGERDDEISQALGEPKRVQLELRNMKSNGRSKSMPQFVTFAFYPDGRIAIDDKVGGNYELPNLVAEVLAAEPMTVAQIRKAIKEDTGEDYTEGAISKVLARGARFEVVGTKRPKTWQVKP